MVPLQTGIGLTYIRLTVDVIIHSDGYFHTSWCPLQMGMEDCLEFSASDLGFNSSLAEAYRCRVRGGRKGKAIID